MTFRVRKEHLFVDGLLQMALFPAISGLCSFYSGPAMSLRPQKEDMT